MRDGYDGQKIARGGVRIPAEESGADPNREQRDYALTGESPLVGLIDSKIYPPYIPDRSHAHNCLELGICLVGQGQVELGRRTFDYGPGVIAAAGRGLYHRQENTARPGTWWRYVLIDEEALLREAPGRHRPALRRLVDALRREGLYYDAGEENGQLRRLLQSIFETYERRGDASRMELEAAAVLLACIMARSVSAAVEDAAGVTRDPSLRGPIEPALQYVSENYARDVRVEDMAARCAMSPSYFRKVFARTMNMSPLEYVNRYRINRASNLMQSTSAPIHQIAAQTGFSSPATFNRNFRRFTGMSPAQWRRSAHI